MVSILPFYKSWRSNLSTTFKLVFMYIKYNSLKPQFPGMFLCSYTKYLIMVKLQNICPCYLLGHFPVFIHAKYWYTPFLYQPQLSTVKWFQSKLSTFVSTLRNKVLLDSQLQTQIWNRRCKLLWSSNNLSGNYSSNSFFFLFLYEMLKYVRTPLCGYSRTQYRGDHP